LVLVLESIQKLLATADDTGHSDKHNVQGNTPFWMCKVRCWRWLFGDQIPISGVGVGGRLSQLHSMLRALPQSATSQL